MALMIIGLLAVGFFMTSLGEDDPLRFDLYMLHKSFGVTILALLVIRLLSKCFSYMPALPKQLLWIEKALAKTVHAFLYIVMIAMPLSGIVMSNGAGYVVSWFGFELPLLINKSPEVSKLARQYHEWIAYGFIALISLHVLGALKHRFFDSKDKDVLSRML
jgi:cytochrome b561